MAPALPRPQDAIQQAFNEAIAYFRGKTNHLTREEWDALTDEAKQRAFTVAGVARLDVIRSVWEALDRTIAAGGTLEDFKATAGPMLEAEWGGTVASPGARLETIFRTNSQTAFAAGRAAVHDHPDVRRIRRYRLFDATLDGRTSETCKTRDGIVLPADDPWWAGNSPPLHHRCRSGVISLRESQAKQRGIKTTLPADIEPPGEGFGKPPTLTWAPDPEKYPEELRPFLPVPAAAE